MARLVQCSNCKTKHEKIDLIEYGSKRLCKKCYKQQLEMERLRQYICKLYKMDYVSPKLQKQINEFVELHNYKPKAIIMIIDYAINIEKFEIDTSLESITFVNYFKHNAVKYYTEKKAIYDSVKTVEKPILNKVETKIEKSCVKNRKILNIEDFNLED